MKIAPPSPAVSVVLAVRNGMPHLPAALESLWLQTRPDFELILVDNGSTDGTSALARGIDDRRLRYIRHEPAGLAGALNRGMADAGADFIARMDADDVAEPERLARQVEFMEADPECVLLGSAFSLIDEGGRVTGEALNVVHDPVLRWAMLLFNPFCHSGVMLRRSAVEACGGYDEDVPVAQDFELWCRLSGRGSMHNLETVLTKKRFTQQSITGQSSMAQSEYAARAVRPYCAGYAPELDVGLLIVLRDWYAENRCPPLPVASQLPAFFTACCRRLSGVAGGSCRVEAQQLESTLRGLLSYRAYSAAKRSIYNPWRVGRLMQIGTRFDAAAGSPRVRAQRWLRRMMRSSSNEMKRAVDHTVERKETR